MLGGLKKTKVKNLTGAPSSHSIGQEKLRTVFVFAIAHLEGPHPAFAIVNSHCKIYKNLFSAIKSTWSLSQWSS